MLPPNHKLRHDERHHMMGDHFLPDVEADNIQVKDGLWTDPTVWSAGVVPAGGAKVIIPTSRTLIYNADSGAEVKWIKNHGLFKFSTKKPTRLVIDTFLSTPRGALEIGNPAWAATGKMEFIGGALDKTHDASEMGRGLVTAGRVMIHGRKLVPFARLPAFMPAGTASFTIPTQYDVVTGAVTYTGAQVAATWRVGDTLYFPSSTQNQPTHNDEVTITAISGAVITLSNPLAYPHEGLTTDTQGLGAGVRRCPGTSLLMRHHAWVANETRSYEFMSQDPGGVRGHLMFMSGRRPDADNLDRREDHKWVPSDIGPSKDPGISCNYFKMTELGRTLTIASPRIGAAGNQVGRYSGHFHHAGHWSQDPIRCIGLQGVGNVGWGLVRHGSHVHVERCSFRGVSQYSPGGGGAVMVDEDDTELGHWMHNMVYCCQGRPDRPTGDLATIYNNEDNFQGIGHNGDGITGNRNSAIIGTVAMNLNHVLHLHQNRRNTRSGINGHYGVVAGDRQSDAWGLVRRGFLSSQLQPNHHKENQPSHWSYTQAVNVGTILRVFHRQFSYTGNDMHVLIKGCVSTKASTHIAASDYVYNYFVVENSFNGGTLWSMGSISFGFPWVRNRIEDVGNFASFVGLIGDIRNAGGGFVDNELVNTTTTRLATPRFDWTNHDSSTWTTIPAHTVQFTSEPHSGQSPSIRGWITDSWTGNVNNNIADSDSHLTQRGPRPLGWAPRTNGSGPEHVDINEAGTGTNRSWSMSIWQLVETWGCVPNGTGGHYLPVYLAIRDRLTTDIKWFRTTVDVTTALSAAFRAKHQIPADPGPPLSTEMPASMPDYNVTNYASYVDPVHNVHYVITDGVVQVDASEAHTDLLVGQSREVVRTFHKADGTGQRITFTIPGRGAAPSMVEPPVLTHMGSAATSVRRGPDGYDTNQVDWIKGKSSGFPRPYHIGSAMFSATNTTFGLNDYDLARSELVMTASKPDTTFVNGNGDWQVGYHRLDVVLHNEHGDTAPVQSNVFQIRED